METLERGFKNAKEANDQTSMGTRDYLDSSNWGCCLFGTIFAVKPEPPAPVVNVDIQPPPVNLTVQLPPEETIIVQPSPVLGVINQWEVNQEIQRVFPTIRSISGEGRQYTSYSPSLFEIVAQAERLRLLSYADEAAARELYNVLRAAFPCAAIGKVVDRSAPNRVAHYVIFFSKEGTGIIGYGIDPHIAKPGILKPSYTKVIIEMD